MSILFFDETKLRKSLSRFSARQVSAFAITCADRLANDVCRLRAEAPGLSLLKQAHDLIWQAIQTGGGGDTVILEQQLLDAMPDEDDDDSLEAAVLEDACAAMVYAMRSLHSDKTQNAAWSARRAYETADRFASRMLNEPEYNEVSERGILEHHAVQRELNRQARDIAIIGDRVIEENVGLDRIRSSARTESVLER